MSSTFSGILLSDATGRVRHCYQNGDPSRELSIEKLTDVFHIMEDAVYKWGKHGSVSLTGGEPFLRKEELYRLMSLLDSSRGAKTDYQVS